MNKIKIIGAFLGTCTLYAAVAAILGHWISNLSDIVDPGTIGRIFAGSCLLSYAICGVIGFIIFDLRFNDSKGVRSIARFENIAICLAFAMFGMVSLLVAITEESSCEPQLNVSKESGL